MKYWLLKSEPSTFSFDDLWKSPKRTTRWDGVRNFQARNYLRDDMQVGDLVFFYHSSTDPTAIVGIAEVVKAGYPDPSAAEEGEKVQWYAVDIRAKQPATKPITLAELRQQKGLAHMVLLQKGSRLSVQPVTEAEWNLIYRLAFTP
ncbi:MAG TPA: EVE domain-containing protein [Gemmatimonadaceae bacterium]|nr:EVE domain-containing protein [Gemmatimonadaceae bacterium]